MREPSEYLQSDTLDMIQTFLLTCKQSRTRTSYFSCLNIICDFCHKDFLEIDYEDARAFFDNMQSQYYNQSITHGTICVRLSCYNSFAKFVMRNYPECEYKNPFLLIPRPVIDTKINPRRIPSLTELDSVLTTAKSMSSMYYVILIFALRMGLSISKIVSIKKSHILCEAAGMFLYLPASDSTKNDLYVKVPEDVRQVLEDYIANIPFSDEEGHIFYNKWNNPLSIKNADEFIRVIMSKSDVLGKYTIKDLRSRAILDMVEAGADTESIATYTGLSNMRVQQFCNASGIVGACPAELVNLRVV